MKRFKKIHSFFDDDTRKMKKNDWIIVIVMMLLYSVLSFVNLGSLKNPQTFVLFNQGNSATIQIDGDARTISKIRHYSGDEVGSYTILVSVDNEEYDEITTFTDESVFVWSDTEINAKVKYLKIVANNSGSYLGEVQLYDEYGEKIKMTAETNQGKLLIDEPDTVPGVISYMNSTYFDEIYFARSAYEYLNDLPTIEWVHPPLGKLIQMLPISILGMTPFAYRLMGNIAGILMIGAMYIFGKNVFKSRKYAFLTGILMMFDNFHFAQTRMGTVDSFLVLFMIISALYMYKYLVLGKNDSLKTKKKYLFLSGLFFGLSVCVKWTGMYLGLGLCIMFFGKMIMDVMKDKKVSKQYANIILSCILYFVIIPCVIYVMCYFLFPNVYPGRVNSFSDLFNQISNMYEYHSTLVADHPFTSKWYTWPLMLKPVWYYVSYPSTGLKSTIVGIGNPLIWWVGILASLFVLINTLRKRKLENVFTIVMILAMWLPYLFIGRIMFMYHFFPVLPFIMLAIVSFIKWLVEKFKTNWIMIFYIIAVIVVFTWFYPVTSGTVMPESYIESIKWLDTWYF